jgi:hypothetical protein
MCWISPSSMKRIFHVCEPLRVIEPHVLRKPQTRSWREDTAGVL